MSEPADRALPGAESPPREIACDPTWNHAPRALLFYAIPLALLGLCLQNEWVGASRDFWVPLIWGFCVPALATGKHFGKPWVLKDFLDRDGFPPLLAVTHAALWSIAIRTTGNPLAAVPLFMALFFAYDALLIHFDLLQVRALPRRVVERGTAATLLAFGIGWWLYAGAVFALAHVHGSDSLGAVALWGVVAQLPPLALFALHHRGAARPERLRARRVAVIGAGFSGCYATKWLTELGADAVCFEAGDDIGGVWRYRADRPGGVFETTRATSSKHFLHAMDFPLPEATPDFPHHGELLAHLEAYVDHFGIRDRIHLRAPVVALERRVHGWTVTTGAGEDRREHEVDAVVVCTGPQGRARLDRRRDPVLDRFAGTIVHAAEYKHARAFPPGESVLVLGAGESAADIVHECAEAGLDVHWSTHHGQWFADRNLGPFAADHFTAVGIRALLGRYANVEYLVRRYVITPFIGLAWGHGGHGVRAWSPQVPYLHQFLNKSRDALASVHRGEATPHGRLESVASNQARFAGEVCPVRVDRIIVATGYQPSWPFLEAPPARLYKKVFDPADPTLSFIGLARPVLGSIPALAEMQARWVASVLTGRSTLPDPRRRDLIVWLDARAHPRRFLDPSPYDSLCDHEVYATDLAGEMGAEVRWLRLLWSSPKTFWATLTSPWIAFKYMLNDADPRRRSAAAQRIRRELPDGRHPVYMLVWLHLAATAGALLALVCVFWVLPAPIALYTLSGLVTAAAATFRLLDRPRGATRRAGRGAGAALE